MADRGCDPGVDTFVDEAVLNVGGAVVLCAAREIGVRKLVET